MSRQKEAGAAVLEKQGGGLVVDPVIHSFLDALAAKGAPPIYTMPVGEARGVLDSLQSAPVAKQEAQIEDLMVPGGPSGEVSVRIVRPAAGGGTLPAIMYFHGGGWILGDKVTHDRLVREIANGAGAAVVFVNYTPSPEARYPVALEQAYAATKYFAEQGASHGIDPGSLAVAGDSVGGNMATLVALLAKERGGPQIGCQALFYPVTDASMDTPSYRQFAEGPWLTKPAMEWFWNAYEPDAAKRADPLLSPLNAPIERLQGLPPALVITDENDVLRDEGEAYARKLLQAGVEVTAVRVLGSIHDFAMLNPLAGAPSTRDAIGFFCNWLKTGFEG